MNKIKTGNRINKKNMSNKDKNNFRECKLLIDY